MSLLYLVLLLHHQLFYFYQPHYCLDGRGMIYFDCPSDSIFDIVIDVENYTARNDTLFVKQVDEDDKAYYVPSGKLP